MDEIRHQYLWISSIGSYWVDCKILSYDGVNNTYEIKFFLDDLEEEMHEVVDEKLVRIFY